MLPITPFRSMATSPEGDSRRARLAVLAATIGIIAVLLAYAVSPGVRHAVGHVRHSVGHALHHSASPKPQRGAAPSPNA
jgi:hypothetical protein